MEKSIKGTRTEQNLLKSFAGSNLRQEVVTHSCKCS